MKKIIIAIFSLLNLISCSHVGSNKEPVEKVLERISSSKNEDFKLTDMMLIIKVNHNNQTFQECTGVLPYQQEQEFINNLYNKNKVNSQLIFESKEIVEFKEGTFNYIVLNVAKPQLIDNTINNCKKIQEELLSQKYEMKKN